MKKIMSLFLVFILLLSSSVPTLAIDVNKDNGNELGIFEESIPNNDKKTANAKATAVKTGRVYANLVRV